MRRNIKSIVALLLSVVMMVTTLLPVVAVEQSSTYATTTYSKESNSGTRDEVCTSLDGTSASSYYPSTYSYDALSQKSSSEIKSALKSLMTSTHKYTSSYNDCHYKADQTDCENNNGKVTLIYTSYQATMSQWNGWNREHVWPQSLGGGNTSGGGADLHHIRPSDAGVNTSRGNKKYGYSNNGTAKYGSNPAVGVLGGHYNSTYYEPLDNVKGDVARIILYVWVRWGTSWGAESVTEVFQSVDVLLEWCKLDPVDTWEMGRNEVIQKIQGNRNVFIDYPEYAWLLFDRDVPEDMVTPSGKAQTGVTPCEHSYSSKVTAPTCTAKGYTTHTCDICGNSYTDSEVAATGHSYNSVVTAPTCTTVGYTVHTCVTCGNSYRDSQVPTIDHTYNSVVTAPTCNAPGYTTYKCDCGYSYRDDEVAATGHSYADGACSVCGVPDPDHESHTHSYDEVIVTPPTCTTEGYTTYICACEMSYEDSRVAATGHSYNSVVTAPTCTAAGYTTHTCGTCGDSYTDSEVAATGHNYTSVVTAPTCVTAGYTTHTCGTCGDSYKDSEVAATGHSYVNGQCACGTKDPNYIAPSCEHTETVLRGEVASTCGKGGYTGDLCCVDCDKTVSQGIQLSPIDHKYDEWELSSDGTTYVSYCSMCGGAKKVMTVNDLLATAGSDSERILLALLLGSADFALLEGIFR